MMVISQERKEPPEIRGAWQDNFLGFLDQVAISGRTKSRGPKGLQLEVGAWSAPRLLVEEYPKGPKTQFQVTTMIFFGGGGVTFSYEPKLARNVYFFWQF